MRIFTGNFDSIFFSELRPFWTSKIDENERYYWNSSTETAQQNCGKLCSNVYLYAFLHEMLVDSFEEQFISPFLSDGPSLMLGITIHCIQYSQAMLERGVFELPHSFFHYSRPTTKTRTRNRVNVLQTQWQKLRLWHLLRQWTINRWKRFCFV